MPMNHGLEDRPQTDEVAAVAAANAAAEMRILVVHTRWHLDVINELVRGAVETLASHGISRTSITIQDVPGSYELPLACQRMIEQAKYKGTPYSACIAIGILIKGETMHFEYIADATSHGLMQVGLKTSVPVVFGVLTCLSMDQARARAGIDVGGGKTVHNHGIDWGKTAVEMALLCK